MHAETRYIPVPLQRSVVHLEFRWGKLPAAKHAGLINRMEF